MFYMLRHIHQWYRVSSGNSDSLHYLIREIEQCNKVPDVMVPDKTSPQEKVPPPASQEITPEQPHIVRYITSCYRLPGTTDVIVREIKQWYRIPEELL